MAQATLHDVIELAKQLSLSERRQLLEEVANLLPTIPIHSQYGELAHLGPAPSMEDFDEVRRELSVDFGEGGASDDQGDR